MTPTQFRPDEPKLVFIRKGEPVVTIDFEAGDVTLADGVSNTEAAAAFWEAVLLHNPIKSNPVHSTPEQ